MWRKFLYVLFLIGLFFILAPGLVQAQGNIYYVSTTDGSDGYDGLSTATPFETIAKVNTLDLQPGDQVLFKCGDIWQGEQLIISKSGTAANPITFSSYPAGCANKPILTGSLPITGWTDQGGNIYRADLPTVEFPLGINQLFRDGQRLTMGRWPNLDAGNGGYSFVDSHSAGSDQITDNELPSSVNWAGAIIHLKNIRWSMIDREVTSSSDHTLVLNAGFSCLISGWTNCIGWGYFLNNHLSTLDQDGEWYYDASANQVYLFSAGGPPSNIEGSKILEPVSNTRHGGVILGLRATYVIIENLEIKNWFNHGFSTLSSMREAYAYHHITFRNNIIKDVDAAGVYLRTSIWDTSSGRNGERGGHHMIFSNNIIDGANHFGVTGYVAESIFEDNEIKDIALIKNLNKSAMGCGITREECTENGDGFRIIVHYVEDSGHSNTIRYNRFEKTGYNAIDIFGPYNTVANNFITQACYSKADCGGVRTFGGDSLSATQVYDLSIVDNIIFDIPGNVDGCHASRPAFGMGLYIDHYSRDMEVRGNTVISTTVTGILYQNSTGEIRDNTVYNASSGTAYAGNISVTGNTQATLDNNIMYGLTDNAWTMYSSSLSNFLGSDNNYLFHPYVNQHIAHGPSWTRYTFANWKTYSSLEGNSKTNWFTLNSSDPPLSRIFYNDTKSPVIIDLGAKKYLDLDQNQVVGNITLAPFTSKILIDDGYASLTLTSMTPNVSAADQAADFTLTLNGALFTPNSIVRWDGVDRTTYFVNSSTLTTTILATEVSTVADIQVTVYDPEPPPSGAETDPLIFQVVESLSNIYLPIVLK